MLKSIHIILNIKKKYNKFCSKNKDNYIQFYWIPTHIGIEGNEKCDILVKRATEYNAPVPISIPFTDK